MVKNRNKYININVLEDKEPVEKRGLRNFMAGTQAHSNYMICDGNSLVRYLPD